jgi:hypothetical protein
LIETLAAAGGKVPVEALRGLDVPRTTLGTLVRRGLIELVDEPQDFTASKLKPRQSPFEFEFSAAQKEALAKIGAAVAASQILRPAAARDYGFGKDSSLSSLHARGAGPGAVFNPAGA